MRVQDQLRDINEVRDDPALRAALTNPNVSRRRDNCRHGAPPATADNSMRVAQALDAFMAESSPAELVQAASQWARAQPVGAVNTTHRILHCMAADAILADDWAPAHLFSRLAVVLRAVGSDAGGGGRDAASFDAAAWAHLRRWSLRRIVSQHCGCGCLGRLAEASCALPGCGALHDPEATGVKLRACARCRCVHYCSDAHQQADWKRHKKEECTAPEEA